MRILRAYALCVLSCVCAVAVAAGVFTADSNVKKISLGQTEAEVAVFYSAGDAVIGTDEIKVRVGMGDYDKVKMVLSVLPPPVSNIYWLYQGIGELIGKTST